MHETSRPYVSVKFTRVGRIHSYLLADQAIASLTIGEHVVVCDGASSYAHAVVVHSVPQLRERRQPACDSARTVVRRASTDDEKDRERIADRERHAHQFCLMKIRERGLQMKLTRVEQLADRSKLLFYFTAEGRVDFRELVRDLASEFHMRIELRQIGVRDEARMLGGYGPCGRALCCTTFLDTFEPVSIKMAKQQHLSLNPSKLSGVCGRLKCCLRFELPNARGETHAGCAHESSCSGGCAGDGGCATGGGGCGSCASR
ncbi:MAG: stage 0 sporulation protein [Acidobacteria bacterium]|jgi:cell fate regulator YaaT (PSP1 superfamily)|nr:stage 0 sporulation protein [Acidobacteriota bacterium]